MSADLEDDQNEELAPENNQEAGDDAGNTPASLADEDDDDDEGEDLRVAHEQIEDPQEEARARRQRRKERQRAARERTQAELHQLREDNRQIRAILESMGGTVQQTYAQSVEQRLGWAKQHLQVAEQQIADATNRGDGEALTKALRYRDEASRAQTALEREIGRLQQGGQRPTAGATQQVQETRQQQDAPVARSLAQEWAAANPWFDYNSTDPRSTATRQAEQTLMREGKDPNTREFWRELSKRSGEAIAKLSPPPKRGGPPVAGAAGGAKGDNFQLSAERVQAIKDAGAWEDPDRKARMIKAYKDFDKQNQRRAG